ncbi:beta-ketoacyl-ACP synthase III [Colwellia sp. RSH04]|uniref:beta-ketoacyl-ACP synthase III n=1 Tax=Colwellia sp. RSH04 TaxID=2305464 RepID=UPI000E578485|nr:beta-ketoacyl-ACP synthase III [Colwellia sp. RSH04]RHW77507.1 beta-ketoacyl-ACP synthase III [Colwellia sp. RSH04]
MAVVISGTGLFTPPESISNDELVQCFNQYVDKHNEENSQAIANGEITALSPSDSAFIEKASGIKSRYVMSKKDILDVNIMSPRFVERPNEALSMQAEIGVAAAKDALKAANKTPADVDLIIVACAYTQRSYPAMAIEIQQVLGCGGWAFDMLVACSAATFGIINAANAIRSGTAKTVLVINPEILSPQINYKDRDSHFIFGDVATASVIEDESTATGEHIFKIIAEQPITQFSNNIRSNMGYTNACTPETLLAPDKFFIQQGRKVFKEVLPMVSQLISEQMTKVNLQASDIKRLYLHQANINMNNFIAKKVLEREPSAAEAPIILDEYANTSSAGCIIALHKNKADLVSEDKAVLCSFGAGYSACCLILEYV